MNPTKRRKTSHVRRGAVTVEFALTSSLFFMLLFAAGEFLRVSMTRHEIQLVAYEAASLATTPGATDDQITEKAQTLLAAAGIDDGAVEISRETTLHEGQYVTVEVRVPLGEIAWYTPAIESMQHVRGAATLKTQWPDATTQVQTQTAGLGSLLPRDFRFDALR